MTVSNVHVLHGLNTASNFYSQVESADPQLNTQDLTVIPSGHFAPMFTAANGQKPELTLTTNQLATLLAECGVAGAASGQVDLYYRKVDAFGDRVADATAEHVRFRSPAGLIYLQSISAGNHRVATAAARLLMMTDGATAACVYSGTAALTGITPTAAESYVLGAIKLNTATIKGCDDFELAFNAQVFEEQDESNDDISFAAIDMLQPVYSFTTTDASVWALHNTAVAPGVSGVTDGMVCNLLRMEQDGAKYASGSAQHITLQSLYGRIHCQSISGKPSATRVSVVARSNSATTVPVTITVNTVAV